LRQRGEAASSGWKACWRVGWRACWQGFYFLKYNRELFTRLDTDELNTLNELNAVVADWSVFIQSEFPPPRYVSLFSAVPQISPPPTTSGFGLPIGHPSRNNCAVSLFPRPFVAFSNPSFIILRNEHVKVNKDKLTRGRKEQITYILE
jgi:hypothetical protein